MENDNITIEEVKKIANEKRKKTISADLAQKRLENLAKGREVRKQKLAEGKNGADAKPVVVSAPEAEPVVVPAPSPVPVSTPSAPQRKPKSKPNQNSIVMVEDKSSFNKLEESINKLKEDIIKAVNEKPKKIKKPPKAPVINKTLDLTITDEEISNIIDKKKEVKNEIKNEMKDYKNKGDEKLASFLKALQKK
jgi:hypothetical protein